MVDPTSPTLETQNLQLRQLRNEDVNPIFILRSDPRVLKYLSHEPAKNHEDARQFINMINEGGSHYWVIDLKPNFEFAGTVCLWNFSPEENSAEIGYSMLPDFQGKGIMFEAIQRVLEFGFSDLKLDSIEAYTLPENLPSVRVLEKSGFVFEGNFEVFAVYRKLKPSPE